EKILAARYGAEAVDHFTYVIAGDGCLMEGISHEALSLAGHLQLSKLIVLWDDNGITIDGKTKIAVSDDVLGRFTALGWDVQSCDGHDRKAVAGCIAAAQKTGTPSLIACKTAIGKGAPTMVGTAKVHGSPLGDEEIAGMRAKLDWPEERFALPDGVLEAWRAVGAKGAAARKAWGQRLGQMAEQDRTALLESLAGSVGPAVIDALNAHKAKLAEDKPTQATRVASQKALEAFFPAVPSLLGGSADLTGSNNTKPAGEVGIVSADDASGRYIHYGVREHGMAAAMNGLALHGGFIPYGGTFLVFTDYLRPSLRMAALMETRVIYVMTHDSIGLGEDGPTHQPVEHLASLRAMPGVQVFRPADAVETAECWAAAMLTPDQPSVLALTRQGLPTLRTEYREDNPCAEGGYVLAEAEGGADARKATIIASGSEVEIAMAARDALAEKDIPVAVDHPFPMINHAPEIPKGPSGSRSFGGRNRGR
ncbi:MAG: transketolase-like TK C-terminal-containing protein, partial [Rhodospirillaceae bacterium]